MPQTSTKKKALRKNAARPKRKYNRSNSELSTKDEFGPAIKESVNALIKQINPIMSTSIPFELLSTIRYDPLLADSFDSLPYDTTNDLANSNLSSGGSSSSSSTTAVDGESTAVGTHTRSPESIPEEAFFLLGLHVARLKFTINFFDWDLEAPYDFVLQELRKTVAALDPSLPYKLRLLISKEGDFTIESHSVAIRPDLFSGLDPWCTTESPLYTVYVDSESTMISPFTSFKTTKRDHYNAARARSLPGIDPGLEEVLLYNTKDEITEGSITNIAFLRNDNWVTPFLPSGCLCGVTRHYLIKQEIISEGKILLKDVKDGEHILLFNAIIGVCKGVVNRQGQTPENGKDKSLAK